MSVAPTRAKLGQDVDSSNNHPIVSVILDKRCMIVKFQSLQRALSWAIIGGGQQVTDTIVCAQVTNNELPKSIDPVQYLEGRMKELNGNDRVGQRQAIGLLTSHDVSNYFRETQTHDDVIAECIATVGLSNRVRIDDSPVYEGDDGDVGTVNIVSWVSIPLSLNAHIEALSIITEARTAAILDAGVPVPMQKRGQKIGRHATGTGTDCIVCLCPATDNNEANYAGKHTAIGHVIGASVYNAVHKGASAWIDANGPDTFTGVLQ